MLECLHVIVHNLFVRPTGGSGPERGDRIIVPRTQCLNCVTDSNRLGVGGKLSGGCRKTYLCWRNATATADPLDVPIRIETCSIPFAIIRINARIERVHAIPIDLSITAGRPCPLCGDPIVVARAQGRNLVPDDEFDFRRQGRSSQAKHAEANVGGVSKFHRQVFFKSVSWLLGSL